MARRSKLRIDKVEIRATQSNVTGVTGLAMVTKYLESRGFFALCNKRLPNTSSNSGYTPDVYMRTLIGLRLLYGGESGPIARIDDMRESVAVRMSLALKEMPCSEAVGDWLRRVAGCEVVGKTKSGEEILGGYEGGVEATRDLYHEMTEKVLKAAEERVGNTLDFDASAIEGEKKCDKKMYTGEKGSMGYFGFMGRLCVMAELEEGNHSPSDNIGKRIKSCTDYCEGAGVRVEVVRSDSAAYEAEVFNDCDAAGRSFYVRADMDSAVRGECGRIGDWGSCDVEVSKGKTAKMELGTAVHCMEDTDHAFMLVVKRVIEEEKEEVGGQGKLEELNVLRYGYYPIATNQLVRSGKDPEDGEGLSAAAVVEIYNDHCEVENRVKEMKSDVGIGDQPTNKLEANRVYVYIMAMLHNLIELFKYECLPAECATKRLPTIVREILAIPGKVVLCAHKLTVDVCVYLKEKAKLFERIHRVTQRRMRIFSTAGKAPAYRTLIFRRE